MRFSLPLRPDFVILLGENQPTEGIDPVTKRPAEYKGLKSGFILKDGTEHVTLVSIPKGKKSTSESTTTEVEAEEIEEDPAPTSADRVLQDDTPVVELLQRGSTALHHRDESDLELERMKLLENSYQGNSSDTVVVVSK